MAINSPIKHVGAFSILPGWENKSSLRDVVGVLKSDLFGRSFPMLMPFGTFASDAFS